MAGLGAKLWTVGEIATAANINGYLQDQTVMKFASTAARDAAFDGVGEPTLSEGMFAYTSDTDTLWFYTGSAWQVATIKPSVIDAKGDLLAGTAADTVDRLAVGSNTQVLTANSAASTGLSWTSIGSITAYTPALTATVTDPVLGTGAITLGRYATVNKVCFVQGVIIFGTSGVSAGVGNYRISLPLAGTGGEGSIGVGRIRDASAGYVAYVLELQFDGTTQRAAMNYGSGAALLVGATVPITFSTSDQIFFNLTYELA